MSGKCILNPSQYNTIWRVSFIQLFCFIYALHRQHYIIAICPGGVFITSINYWIKPDYSWRRYIDMVYVKSSILYQIIRAYNAEYCKMYYMTLFISLCFYPVGIYYYNKKMYWHSTYTHCLLHITGAMTNIILYSGYIR